MSRGWLHAGLLATSLAVTAITIMPAEATAVTPTAPDPVPSASPSSAPSASPMAIPPEAAKALALLAQRNAPLQSYTFDLRVKLAMHTFPWLQPYLIGSGTYQKPGHYTITFRQVPALAKNYQKVTGEMLDPSNWPEKYEIAVGKRTGSDVELILHERVKGEITEARAVIDTATGSVKRMHFLYEHGGTIDLVQHSASIDGFVLPVEQDAEIAMPGFKATGHATFDNYHLQVGHATAATDEHLVRAGVSSP